MMARLRDAFPQRLLPGVIALLLLSACSSGSDDDSRKAVNAAGQSCLWGESNWDECHWAE